MSYDVVKQTGDWQCGGRTHEDHGAAFDSLFLGKVEGLASSLQSSAGLERGEARQMLCQLFQASHVTQLNFAAEHEPAGSQTLSDFLYRKFL